MIATEVPHLEFVTNIQQELQKERVGIHLSDLDLCLKSSYYRKVNPQPLSMKQAVIFAIGLGVQQYMYPHAETTYECDGILCSPDANRVEVKTTRENAKNYANGINHPHWIWRIKGYCHVLNVLDYYLDIVFVGTAEVKSYHLTFTQDEIDLMWEEALVRKSILANAFRTHEPPMPDFHPDWLCKYCEHSGNCYIKKV